MKYAKVSCLCWLPTNGYAKPYLADKRKVICIGVSFSSSTRTVEDWEEISL
ncbi:hypothetical protein [uncultured Bacteroides sp.]|uniref:hypothetical protein n=1 Tax=Bacteroides congonensis TaxID=1871006 RepID=UPI0035A8832D